MDMLDKTLAGTAGGFSVLALLDNVFITMFGVPLPVIGMAAAGALFSNAYSEESSPRRSRRRLYLWVAGTTFISSVSVAVVPPMLGLEWVVPSLQAPLAGFIAFFSQWFLPKLVEAFPDIIRKIFRLESKEGNYPYYRYQGRGYEEDQGYYEDDYEDKSQ